MDRLSAELESMEAQETSPSQQQSQQQSQRPQHSQQDDENIDIAAEGSKRRKGQKPPPSAKKPKVLESNKTTDPGSKQPATQKPAAKKPVVEKPTAQTPATNKPATDKPASDKSATDKPAMERTASKKAAKNNKPTEAPGKKKKIDTGNQWTPDLPNKGRGNPPPTPGRGAGAQKELKEFCEANWYFHDCWLPDVEAGDESFEPPPRYVRLDDYNVGRLIRACTLGLYEQKRLHDNWPYDIDRDGMIKNSRKNVGVPYRVQHDGKWHFVTIVGYCLSGDWEDIANMKCDDKGHKQKIAKTMTTDPEFIQRGRLCEDQKNHEYRMVNPSVLPNVRPEDIPPHLAYIFKRGQNLAIQTSSDTGRPDTNDDGETGGDRHREQNQQSNEEEENEEIEQIMDMSQALDENVYSIGDRITQLEIDAATFAGEFWIIDSTPSTELFLMQIYNCPTTTNANNLQALRFDRNRNPNPEIVSLVLFDGVYLSRTDLLEFRDNPENPKFEDLKDLLIEKLPRGSWSKYITAKVYALQDTSTQLPVSSSSVDSATINQSDVQGLQTHSRSSDNLVAEEVAISSSQAPGQYTNIASSPQIPCADNPAPSTQVSPSLRGSTQVSQSFQVSTHVSQASPVSTQIPQSSALSAQVPAPSEPLNLQQLPSSNTSQIRTASLENPPTFRDDGFSGHVIPDSSPLANHNTDIPQAMHMQDQIAFPTERPNDAAQQYQILMNMFHTTDGHTIDHDLLFEKVFAHFSNLYRCSANQKTETQRLGSDLDAARKQINDFQGTIARPGARIQQLETDSVRKDDRIRDQDARIQQFEIDTVKKNKQIGDLQGELAGIERTTS